MAISEREVLVARYGSERVEIMERKRLREKLLGEIYDHHFVNYGGKYSIADEANSSSESFLAYLYLYESGLITAEIDYDLNGDAATIDNADITFKGIGVVEGVQI